MNTWEIGGSLFQTGRSYAAYKQALSQSSLQSGFFDGTTTIQLRPPQLNPNLTARIVGIVRKELLDKCTKEGRYYIIHRQLRDVFDMGALERLDNLDPTCREQPSLPDGTGIAIADNVVLTAGHVVRIMNPSFYRVVQFQVTGNRLDQEKVYEIDSFIDTRCGEEPSTVDAYESNLKGGEWAILKLKQPMKGVNGPLSMAEGPQVFAPGRKVTILGHPHGLPLRETEGKIVSFNQGQTPPMVEKYEAETLRGMSGGPVFDKNTGQLLGLHLRGRFTLAQYNNGPILRVCAVEPVEHMKSELQKRGLIGEFFQSVVPVMERLRLLHVDRPPVSTEESVQLRPSRQPLPTQSPAPATATQSDSGKRFMHPEGTGTTQPTILNPKIESQNVQAVQPTTWTQVVFGAVEWNKYFGHVGVAPPFPAKIDKIMNSPCPFVDGKKIHETHLLVLVPNAVNGQSLTLSVLDQLVRHPQGGGHATWLVIRGDPESSAPASHWVLITREAHLRYNWQRYERPRLLDAATAFLAQYVKTASILPNT
ncbi:MAG: trypsin-like peptidase domain-containing protein, partial [Verrucomicrobia bacterium]|nr:trypsin-like peptidase domain-containing protein [Verrucomicrobiota bacterium]